MRTPQSCHQERVARASGMGLKSTDEVRTATRCSWILRCSALAPTVALAELPLPAGLLTHLYLKKDATYRQLEGYDEYDSTGMSSCTREIWFSRCHESNLLHCCPGGWSDGFGVCRKTPHNACAIGFERVWGVTTTLWKPRPGAAMNLRFTTADCPAFKSSPTVAH